MMILHKRAGVITRSKLFVRYHKRSCTAIEYPGDNATVLLGRRCDMGLSGVLSFVDSLYLQYSHPVDPMKGVCNIIVRRVLHNGGGGAGSGLFSTS
jgi:hypothetical protein